MLSCCIQSVYSKSTSNWCNNSAYHELGVYWSDAPTPYKPPLILIQLLIAQFIKTQFCWSYTRDEYWVQLTKWFQTYNTNSLAYCLHINYTRFLIEHPGRHRGQQAQRSQPWFWICEGEQKVFNLPTSRNLVWYLEWIYYEHHTFPVHTPDVKIVFHFTHHSLHTLPQRHLYFEISCSQVLTTL